MSTGFIGNFKYSIDAKGRVSIPAKLRKYVSPEANDTYVMTRGIKKNIDIYPLDIWKSIYAKLENLNSFDPMQSLFIEMIYNDAREEKLDSQARLLIPKGLIEYAGIEKDVLIKGVLNKIVLWNPQIHDEYINSSKLSYEEVAQQVMGK